MVLRCSHCGSTKFFFTQPSRENSHKTYQHGACCAVCGKRFNLDDFVPALPCARARSALAQ